MISVITSVTYLISLIRKVCFGSYFLIRGMRSSTFATNERPLTLQRRRMVSPRTVYIVCVIVWNMDDKNYSRSVTLISTFFHGLRIIQLIPSNCVPSKSSSSEIITATTNLNGRKATRWTWGGQFLPSNVGPTLPNGAFFCLFVLF